MNQVEERERTDSPPSKPSDDSNGIWTPEHIGVAIMSCLLIAGGALVWIASSISWTH